MARPRSYSLLQLNQVLALKKAGTPITSIMAITGLSHGTIQRILERARDTVLRGD